MEPIISPNTRIRHREHVHVGRYSIIDDFCYISTQVRIGVGSHVASGCSIAGGVRHRFSMGDFSSLSSGVKIWCASNNFVDDLVMIALPGFELEGVQSIEGDVVIEDFTGVGANSVVMPQSVIPEGTVVGSLSFVPPQTVLEPWSVYAGIPVRYIKPRNRDNVMRQVEQVRRWFNLRKEGG